MVALAGTLAFSIALLKLSFTLCGRTGPGPVIGFSGILESNAPATINNVFGRGAVDDSVRHLV